MGTDVQDGIAGSHILAKPIYIRLSKSYKTILGMQPPLERDGAFPIEMKIQSLGAILANRGFQPQCPQKRFQLHADRSLGIGKMELSGPFADDHLFVACSDVRHPEELIDVDHE